MSTEVEVNGIKVVIQGDNIFITSNRVISVRTVVDTSLFKPAQPEKETIVKPIPKPIVTPSKPIATPSKPIVNTPSKPIVNSVVKPIVNTVVKPKIEETILIDEPLVVGDCKIVRHGDRFGIIKGPNSFIHPIMAPRGKHAFVHAGLLGLTHDDRNMAWFFNPTTLAWHYASTPDDIMTTHIVETLIEADYDYGTQLIYDERGRSYVCLY